MSAQNKPTAEEQLKALQAQNAQLQAQLKRQEEEYAAKIDKLHQEYQQGKKPLVEIPGTVELSLIPKRGGKRVKKTYGIKDGHPKVRLHGAVVVKTKVLLQLANGQKLTEAELEENPGLKGWDKAKTINFLTDLAAKQVAWLVPVK